MTDRARLARIMRVKERVRDARAGALMEAERDEKAAAESVEAADRQLIRVAAAYTAPGEMTAGELVHRAQLVSLAKERREVARLRHEAADEVKAERAVALGDAQRDVRSLEVVGDRLASQERRDRDRREQAASDEHGSRRTG
ncbi:MAG: hypothetical protein AB8I08_23075 [Sandaracinaceae bacterium]